ncbi:MAG: hypothetical protein FWE06_02620 [Oscillospiraceae bacterium]|nr:hypothetical protein [Oscillospiraceae bacterium]
MLALQLTIVPYGRILGAMFWLPPLLLGSVLAFESGGGALLYAGLLGTWCDVYLHSGILFTLLYPLITLVAWRYADNFPRRSWVTMLIIAVGSSLLGQLLYAVLFLLAAGRANISLLWTRLPLETALSLLGVPVVYPIFRKIAEPL